MSLNLRKTHLRKTVCTINAVFAREFIRTLGTPGTKQSTELEQPHVTPECVKLDETMCSSILRHILVLIAVNPTQ